MAAILVGQVVDQVIQPRLMGSIVGLQPAWLLIALPLGAKAGDLYGFGDLLGLLLAVPVASSFKTLVDAWAARGDSPGVRGVQLWVGMMPLEIERSPPALHSRSDPRHRCRLRVRGVSGAS